MTKLGTVANVIFGNAAALLGAVDSEADVGYIKDGVTITKNEEIYKLKAEGIPSPIKARRTNLEYTFAFTMIEPTLANIKNAWAVSEAISGTTLEVGALAEASPASISLKVTGVEPGGSDARTIQAKSCISEGPGEVKFTDAEETAVPCVFTTLYNTTDLSLFTITDT